MVDNPENIAHIDQTLYDEKDHVIIVLKDATFSSYKQIEQSDFAVGQSVRLWGWPGSSTEMLYREGVCIAHGSDEDGDFYEFKIPVYPGDSGSGIVNAAGKVVSVVSLGDKSANMIAFPMEFSPEQLKAIK
jgi:V8-like Glu-specific endopeptidase